MRKSIPSLIALLAMASLLTLELRAETRIPDLMYSTPKDTQVELFYNEVVGIADPVATYYMACGFSRGYFGMQVNSPTERRIIFSVWDSGAGQTAKDRSAVSDENRVKLLAKGDRVVASDFGNEGTGGHSHLADLFPALRRLGRSLPDRRRVSLQSFLWRRCR
jgi:hypothetical protein